MPSMNHSGSAERAGGARVDVRAGDVVLEGVHELVAEHVVARFDGAGKRKDDTSLVGFGDAAGALAEIALDGVGLPEVRPARVKDERLTCAQLMIEQLRKARVPTLGHPRGHLGRGLFLRVVIDVEVVGLQYLEIEFPGTEPCCGRSSRPGQGKPKAAPAECTGLSRRAWNNLSYGLAIATDMPWVARVLLRKTIRYDSCSSFHKARRRPILRTTLSPEAARRFQF